MHVYLKSPKFFVFCGKVNLYFVLVLNKTKNVSLKSIKVNYSQTYNEKTNCFGHFYLFSCLFWILCISLLYLLIQISLQYIPGQFSPFLTFAQSPQYLAQSDFMERKIKFFINSWKLKLLIFCYIFISKLIVSQIDFTNALFSCKEIRSAC